VLLVAAVVAWFVLVRPLDDQVRVTLTGMLPDGSRPTAEALDRAGQVLTERFSTAGLTDPRVRVDGDRLVATFRSEVDEAQVRALIGTGELRFRKVIESTADNGECGALADRPAGSVPADQPDVACDDDLRYELGAAALTEADVATATPELDAASGGWQVVLAFTNEGQTSWTELTREASDNVGGECRTLGSGGACQVAIVLDGRVIVAPEVIDVIMGPAVITGAFTRDEAYLLAAQLAHGSQPLVLDIESFER
jgi:preprotein translocase subunit SecD